MGNWGTLNSIIWFLPALFSLNLLFFIFNKVNNKAKMVFLVSSLSMFLFANQIVKFHYNIPFGLDVALYIFILAYIIQYIYKKKDKYININSYYLIGIILILSIILFLYEPIKTHSQWHGIIDLAQFSVATTTIGYTSFIFLNISIFILFLKINSIKIFEYIGIYSFPVFLLHLMVLYKLPSIVSFDSFGLSMIFLIVTLLLTFILPIIVSRILMKLSNKFKYIGMVK